MSHHHDHWGRFRTRLFLAITSFMALIIVTLWLCAVWMDDARFTGTGFILLIPTLILTACFVVNWENF